MYHCSLHTLSLICCLSLLARVHSQLSSSPSFTRSSPSAVLSPEPVACAAIEQKAPAFSSEHCVIRVGGCKTQIWIPICPSLLLYVQFSSFLSAPLNLSILQAYCQMHRQQAFHGLLTRSHSYVGLNSYNESFIPHH